MVSWNNVECGREIVNEKSLRKICVPEMEAFVSVTKDQWLEETGGFRPFETDEQFLARAARIGKLRAEIKEGLGSYRKITELARLLGTVDGDE